MTLAGLSNILLPSLRTRFAVALIVTFFPCGVLFPLEWPLRELLITICWLFVVPTPLSLTPLVLIPLLSSLQYGYFAFNLFCFFSSAIVFGSMKKNSSSLPIGQMLRLSRMCMILTFLISALQAVSDPAAWSAVFNNMLLGEGGRGAGLRTEPSMIAAPLMIYLTLLYCDRAHRIKAGSEFRLPLLEMLGVSLFAIAITRSLSVALVFVCFLPLLGLSYSNILMTLSIGAATVSLVFWDRLVQAFGEAGGSISLLLTVSLASWRNIPDLLIFLNVREFLLPANPVEVREHITALAVAWDAEFGWLQNTYSLFSSGAATIGVILTCAAFAFGFRFARKVTRRVNRKTLTWISLYFLLWFVMPKFESSVWAAFAMLTEALSTTEMMSETRRHKSHGVIADFWQSLRYRPTQ